MPVKETSKVLKSILSDITNTKRIIKKSEQVKECLKETDLKNEKETKKVVLQTRDIIDELTNEVFEISTAFYEFYDSKFNEIESNLENDSGKTCDSSSGERENSEECAVNGNLNEDNNLEKISKNSTPKTTVIEHKSKNNKDEKTNTNDIVETTGKNANADKESDEHNKSMQNKEEENNKTNKNKPKRCEGKENNNTSKDATTNEKENISGEEENLSMELDPEMLLKEEGKAWIRCVDISKLIEPGATNNTSVIVLSDSDSCSSPIKLPSAVTLTRLTKQNITQIKNNPVNNKKTPSKGVLKTPTSETPNSKKKKSVTFRDPETSDIDDIAIVDTSDTPRRGKLPLRKSRPLELHDVSSLSEDSSDSTSSEEITQSSKKQVYSKRRRGKRSDSPIPVKINVKLDEKFSQKCIVKLPRVHPDTLKRNYEKLLLKNDIARLTNMYSLKRNRNDRRNTSSSDSSSATENVSKRPRTEKKKSEPDKETEKMDVSESSNSDAASDSGNQEPSDALAAAEDLNTNANSITDEDNRCTISEETNLDLLEALGNDSQSKSSDDESKSSNSDEATTLKGKKTVDEEKTKESSAKTDKSASKTKSSVNEKPAALTEESDESSIKEQDEINDEKNKNNQNREKSKWRRDKLLTANLSSSSDSEEDGKRSKKNKEKEKSNEKESKEKDNGTEDKSSTGSDGDESMNNSQQCEAEDESKEKKEDAGKENEPDNEKERGDSNDKSNVEEKNKEKDCANNETDGSSNESITERKEEDKTEKESANTGNKDDNNRKEDDGSDDDSSSTENTNEKEKEANNKSTDSTSDSDTIKKNKSTTKKKKVDENDSDENFAKFLEKSEKLQEISDADEVTPPKKTVKRLVKKKRRAVVNSDSDSSSSVKKKSDSSETESSKSSSNSDSENEEIQKKTKRRRRIRKNRDSSDEDGEDKSTRKHIRKVWHKDSLAETTIAAEKEEAERKARILEKQKKYNQIFEPDALEKSTVDKVVLDFEEEEELLVVHKDITKHLKPHQAKGIQFMWNASFESVERAQKDKGSGCILAHCMGLGKTLQVIALTHTLLSNREKTKVEKVLVVCPLSTVLNWVAEFKKWLPEDDEINVFDIVSFKQNIERLYQIKEWDRCGGALILGYDMFRNLTNPTGKRMSKKVREGFQRYLVDPGPDLVICDEGHLLKNEKTSLSIAMNRLKTARRVVLTGTPLQNNLKEYWCMVQFVKPNLLGTYKEYLNRFVNPIINGQYTDSTQHDIQLMRKRSHVLHKLLDGVVQRRDYGVLAPFLPPKYEYVLFVALTEKQIKLYEYYMKEKARRTQESSGRSSFLFVDFQELQRICTHPRILLEKSIERRNARDKKELEEEESEGSLKDFIDDGSDKSDTTSNSNSSGSESGSDSNDSSKKKVQSKGRRVTRAAVAQGVISDSEEETPNKEPDPLEWWREFVSDEDLDDILVSGKLSLLFEILRHCEAIGDKVLIFSQSLYSLDVIEYFLSKIDDATQNSEIGTYCGFSGSWSLGLDYFRLDGSSSCDNRAAWCNTFNNPENIRARLFLISTRAGGLGINLVAANRVIIFDVSWNPSHDIQSIYRVYRFGQNKPSYIYRFVTLGTMEMKIYERQVIKQAISKRVIDEQQIDRHYNQSDIAELYKFDPKPEDERPIPLVPTDVLLGELLQQDQKIYKYHEHQSLLENKEDEVLDEEERKAAWEEFENEKKARQYTGSINHIPIPSIVKALTSILNRESPALTPQIIQELIPNMLQELQDKMAAGDSTLYNKVLSEIRLMQATVQQQRIEEYYRLQQQHQQNMLLQYQQQLMNNPAAAAQLMSQWSQQVFNPMSNFTSQRGGLAHGSRQHQNPARMPVPLPNVPQTGGQQTSSTDVIELND